MIDWGKMVKGENGEGRRDKEIWEEGIPFSTKL